MSTHGFTCPECSGTDFRTTETRAHSLGGVKRRRHCHSCGYKMVTIERPEADFVKEDAGLTLEDVTQAIQSAMRIHVPMDTAFRTRPEVRRLYCALAARFRIASQPKIGESVFMSAKTVSRSLSAFAKEDHPMNEYFVSGSLILSAKEAELEAA